MSYVLEEMSPADKEKILKDAECDPSKKGWLEVTNHLNREGGMQWVVDRENNSYMFIVVTMREHSANSHFYIFVEGFMYEVSVDGLFGGEVKFFGIKPSGDSAESVKEAIVSALPILGRYGWGVRDSFDVVIPEFKEGI